MKITIDVDISPEELRRFIGLPNVEKIQEQMVKNAATYLKESGAGQYGDLITSAMQPMMAYQQWLQRMMSGNGEAGAERSKPGKKDE